MRGSGASYGERCQGGWERELGRGKRYVNRSWMLYYMYATHDYSSAADNTIVALLTWTYLCQGKKSVYYAS